MSNDALQQFQQDSHHRVEGYPGSVLETAAARFQEESVPARYTDNFAWLGRPIPLYPQDVMALQELIWKVQPELIIETGVGLGGSLVFLASMLELNAVCGGAQDGEVIGIDPEIDPQHRASLEKHPLARRIILMQGNSSDGDFVRQVVRRAEGKRSVLVSLRDPRSAEQLTNDLNAYADLVTQDSYCIVFGVSSDFRVHEEPSENAGGRSGEVAASSRDKVVHEFLAGHREFERDPVPGDKMLISAARGGFLKKRLMPRIGHSTHYRAGLVTIDRRSDE